MWESTQTTTRNQSITGEKTFNFNLSRVKHHKHVIDILIKSQPNDYIHNVPKLKLNSYFSMYIYINKSNYTCRLKWLC